MPKFIDLTGQKFGNLLVIRRVDNAPKNHSRFLCLCDCGKEKEIDGVTIRNGSGNCGCLKPMPHGRLEFGEASFRSLYRYTKLNAKYRGIEFSIDLDFFRWITKQNCVYCGASPNQIYHPKRANGEYIYNGIDRVDNEIGYVPENCVPCCGHCNYIKSAQDVGDFKEWIIGVYHHWASKS